MQIWCILPLSVVIVVCAVALHSCVSLCDVELYRVAEMLVCFMLLVYYVCVCMFCCYRGCATLLCWVLWCHAGMIGCDGTWYRIVMCAVLLCIHVTPHLCCVMLNSIVSCRCWSTGDLTVCCFAQVAHISVVTCCVVVFVTLVRCVVGHFLWCDLVRMMYGVPWSVFGDFLLLSVLCCTVLRCVVLL